MTPTRNHIIAALVGLATLLTFATAADAQDALVTGRVTDQKGEILPGVHVYAQGTRLGTITSSDGTYRLRIRTPGSFVIVASVVGFKRETESIEVQAGETISIDFVLTEVIIESGEVVVTASRRAQLAAVVPASLSVVSARELDSRNIIALDEALRYVSGLQMQDNQVNLRGSSGFAYNTGSRVLLLLDGSQLLSPDTDGVPLDAVPMTQVEQIEVLKGPGSALYGSGAMGGVINVITKAFPDKPRTTAQAYAGAYEKARYRTWRQNWSGADDFRWFSGVRVDHSRRFSSDFGGWISLAYRRDLGYMNLQQNEAFQGYAKLGFSLGEKWRADLLMGAMVREKDSFLFWNGLTDALNPGKLSLNPTAAPNGSNDNFSNQVSLLPAIKFFPDANSFLTTRLRLFGTFIRPIDDQTGKVKSINDGTFGFRYGGEVQYTRTLSSKRGTITTGASFDANTTKSSFFRTSDGDRLGSQPEVAFFGQWEGNPFRRIAAVAGLRLDSYRVDAEESITRLSPKLALSYEISQHLILRAAYGHGFRVPSLAERFTDDRTTFPIYRNPRLKPETSVSYELGMRGLHGRTGPFEGVEWDVAFFWNEYDRFIEPRFVNDLVDGERLVGFQFINLEDSRIAGLEANLSLLLPGEMARLWAGYTYLDTADPDGEELPFRPAHLLVSGATASVVSWLEVGVDFRFASIPGKIDSDFAIFVADSNVLVETRALDARVTASWRHFRFSLLVDNLLDYYYLERPALLAPPRRLTAKIQVDI